MRSKNALKNIFAALLYEIILFVFGMIMPRLIIISYGSEVNGLTSTINQMLNVISLLQAGAVGASIYMLYKKVANEEYEKVSEVLYSSKKYFQRIGCIYLVLSIIFGVIMSLSLESLNLKIWEILISFVVLGFSGSFSFFFISGYDILLSAFQNRWLLSVASTIERFVYFSALVIVIKLNLHFTFMYLAVLFGRICQVVFLKIITSLKYGRIINRNPENKNVHIPNRGYLFSSTASEQIITSSPTLLITYILGLAYSSVYSLYALIYSSLQTIVNAVHLSLSAILGNLVAKGDEKEINRVLNLVCYTFAMIGAFLGSCCIFLIMPFMAIYTKGITDIDYQYPTLAVLITVCILTYSIRMPYSIVSTIFGLFKSILKAVLISGVIGVAVAALMLYFYGISCALVGMFVYHLLVTIILIVALKKNISWDPTYKMGSRIGIMSILAVVLWIIQIFYLALLIVGLFGSLPHFCVQLSFSVSYFFTRWFFEKMNYPNTAIFQKSVSKD
jgi:O-antigen/teichoic acid export membrane protein